MVPVSAWSTPCSQRSATDVARMNRVSTAAGEYVEIVVNIRFVSFCPTRVTHTLVDCKGIYTKVNGCASVPPVGGAKGKRPKGERDGGSGPAGRDHGPGE